MIPQTKAYSTTTVDPAHSRADVESMLDKFKITKTMWYKEQPENTFLVFERRYQGVEKPLIYKVQVPFIEKKIGRYGEIEFDDKRSYRFFFHIFKALLLNSDIGMEFEQIFSNYLVIGKLPDGTPETIQDRVSQSLLSGKYPALEEKKE